MKENTTKETKKYSHLNLEEREEIAILLEKSKKLYELLNYCVETQVQFPEN